MKKCLIVLATLLLLLSLASCKNPTVTPPADSTNEDLTLDESKSGVPEGTDLKNATVKLWYTTVATADSESFIDLDPQTSGDAVSSAIFTTNSVVRKRLNVDLVYYNSQVESTNVGQTIRTLIYGGDDTYDVFNTIEWNTAKLVSEGLFLDVGDMPYLSFDEAWWDYEYMKEMTVDNKIYTLVGDFSVDRTRCLDCIYYNKTLYASLHNGDAEGLYDVVTAGNWTLDYMIEQASLAYADRGVEGLDMDDQLGMILNKENLLDGFFYGAGLKVTKRGDDNIPELALVNQASSDLCAKVMEMVTGQYTGIYTLPVAYDQVANRDKVTKFANGNVLFLPGFFYTAESLLNMKDFGILPYPKASEQQDKYYSIVHNIIREMSLPIYCRQPETVCAVLEELSYEGNKSVLPVYYEQMLKIRYAQDPTSGKMIDLIRDGCVTDIALIYPEQFNYLGITLRKMAQDGETELSIFYSKYEGAAKSKMEEFIDQYLGKK